jgi:hypothetical protein
VVPFGYDGKFENIGGISKNGMPLLCFFFLDLPISGGENLVANMASNYTKIIGEQHIGFSVLFFFK